MRRMPVVVGAARRLAAVPTASLSLLAVFWQPVASQEAHLVWESKDGRLTYAVPFSDIFTLLIRCKGGGAEVDIMLRPPNGKPGQKTWIRFSRGADQVRYEAKLTEQDGLSGDDVVFSVPVSSKLFQFLGGPGAVVARVPGANVTLPAEGGRIEAALDFRRSCQ